MLALALLGGLWLVAGPRDRGSSPASFAGPGIAATSQASAGGPPAAARAKPRRYVVHVAGAVRRPGVYKVHAPGRLIDAVKRAGGLTPDADLTQVNLAARLTDGRQIVVPRLAGAAGGALPAGVAGDPAAAGVAAPTVSLNAATLEQLQTIDGVGPAMAAAIIKHRTELGGYTSLDQLDEVPGVGEKRLATLREQVAL